MWIQTKQIDGNNSKQVFHLWITVNSKKHIRALSASTDCELLVINFDLFAQ